MSTRLHNQTEIRPFDSERDLPAVKRIWREVGWLTDGGEPGFEAFFGCGNTLVATIDGEAECSVHIADGTLRLQTTDLPLCAVTAVTTSRIARGHAFAKRLTAQQLASAAQEGAAVAALGMFDQGFYNQLGFGSGGYDHQFTLDPGSLLVDHRVGTPVRLSLDNIEQMHAAMAGRHKVNGSVVLHPHGLLKADLSWAENGFGLGFYEGEELTHFMWLSGQQERGPYTVNFMAYRSTDELLELLGLLKSLADQVYSVQLIEPPEIQLQDLMERPFRNRAITQQGKHASQQRSFAWWQLRVLDVPQCVGAFSEPATDLTFQMNVSDPLDDMLPPENSWRGVGGSYIVQFGEQSTAEPGTAADLPQLECTVNAFTRMMWGVAPASSLAVTDSLSGPAELLTRLDGAIHLPVPHTGWDF